MSRTFELCCDQCRVTLWIGQGRHQERMTLYTVPPHAERLAQFFTEHMEHPLRVVDSERRHDDYRELYDDEGDAPASDPTDEKLLAELRAACAGRGGQKAFAKKSGLSVAYISTVLSGQRKPSERLLLALGWEKTVIWSRVGSPG